MESQFECELRPTVKMVASRIRKYSPARWIVMLVIGAAFAFYVLPAAILYRFNGIWALYGLMGILYPIYGVFMPEITAWFAIRRFRKETNGEGTERIAFGDQIQVIQGKARFIWDYSEINQVIHLRHSYDLMKNKRVGVTLDPNGFTKGTFAEFKQFLREKRPDLNIPE